MSIKWSDFSLNLHMCMCSIMYSCTTLEFLLISLSVKIAAWYSDSCYIRFASSLERTFFTVTISILDSRRYFTLCIFVIAPQWNYYFILISLWWFPGFETKLSFFLTCKELQWGHQQLLWYNIVITVVNFSKTHDYIKRDLV